LIKNYRQLVSYSGYDVIENSSGTHIGKTKISKKGNSRIRRALFMPALSVVTHNQKPFVDLYNRTYEKHKVKMKSYVAVQKKLLTTMYALWKNDTPFNENHKHELWKSKEQEGQANLCITNSAEEKLISVVLEKINPATNGKAKQGSTNKLYSSSSKTKKELLITKT
jgi:Transposase IS116/IS110/IS902 family